MELITEPKLLQSTFLNLLSSYKQYYWTSAWAGVGSDPYHSLKKHTQRIKKMVVGLHFYQTHPDFIEHFINHKNVRFIKQPAGTFHPKLFLFYNSDNDWKLLTGSNNFTREAFTNNTEAAILIESTDEGGKGILKRAKLFIEEQWSESSRFDAKELADYRNMWKKQRSNIESLSGQYSSIKNRAPKPAFQVGVMTMTWKEFINKVKREQDYGIDGRLKVIGLASGLFRKVNSFHELSADERKFIAGLPNNLPENYNWGYFGSMRGFGDFAKEIGLNNKYISKSLDEVPLHGQITESHYNHFIEIFLEAFKDASKNIQNPIGTATRMLAMKRPDVFVCVDSRNKKLLCEHFGILQTEVTIQSYWNTIVARIMDSEWWLNSTPSNSKEKKVSEARAAFLDALYYERKE